MNLVMTPAEELAALTGAKLTMPTRTLLQGAVHSKYPTILKKVNDEKLAQGTRQRMEGGPSPVPQDEDIAAQRPHRPFAVRGHGGLT